MPALPAASIDPLIVQEFWVRSIVSLIMLGCAAFVILSPRCKPQQKNWAYGTVGVILGYWLRP